MLRVLEKRDLYGICFWSSTSKRTQKSIKLNYKEKALHLLSIFHMEKSALVLCVLASLEYILRIIGFNLYGMCGHIFMYSLYTYIFQASIYLKQFQTMI